MQNTVYVLTVNNEVIGVYTTRERAETAADRWAAGLSEREKVYSEKTKFPWGYGFRIQPRELDAGWEPKTRTRTITRKITIQEGE